jgi:hypothetical protein
MFTSNPVPPFLSSVLVKFFDKVAFTVGVMLFAINFFVLGAYPAYYPLLFSLELGACVLKRLRCVLV